jgi:putative nucleotidyltransferase with HDIG domain
MTHRAKGLVGVVVAGAGASLLSVRGAHSGPWIHFFVYLIAILLSSGMKIAMPKSNGTMCVNFPFILLGIVQLSPYQAVTLAVCSVIAQCRIRVVRSFSLVQILFNVANVITATVLAWYAYVGFLRLRPEVAPALAAASSVYFLANTIPVALIIAWESNAAPLRHWLQEFVWYYPFYLTGAALAAAANFISLRIGWLTSLLLIPVVYIVYRVYCVQRDMVRDRERHIVEIEALHLRAIEGLAMAIEAKDKNTHLHLLRVRVYVSEVGKIMGLDPLVMKALETASVLHDIGKLAVPEHIISKPGKLTREEFEKMKIHPVVGAEILERVRFPYPVVPIVRSHHEAWDGSGYPDGLKGTEIPIGARILTAVDCFDALASDRPYRKAIPLDEAMGFLKSRAGQQFDPDVVAVLEQHYREFEARAREQIAAMAPLETEMVIVRGLAPGAGFAPESASGMEHHAGKTSRGADLAATGLQDLSFKLAVAPGDGAQALVRRDRNGENCAPALETSAAIFQALAPLIPFDCLALYVMREELLLRHFVGGALAEAFSTQPIPVGEGLSGWVAKNQRPILNGNPTVEPNLVKAHAAFSANSSALSIPLFDAQGALVGVLTAYSTQAAAFSMDHLPILEGHWARFALALQRAPEFAAAEGREFLIESARPAAWGQAAL